MQKKLFLLLILTGSCLLTSYAQQRSKAPAAQTSLLWKVSGKGLKQPSYLYGTFHILCKEDLSFSAAALTAFATTQTLFLEINMSDPMMLLKMGQSLMMPEGYSFKTLFSKADFDILTKYCKDSCNMDIAMFDKMKPLAVMSLLIQQSFSCKTASCEEELMKLAKRREMPINGLEALEDQIRLFDSIPDKEEAAMIMQMITEKDARLLNRKMVTAYKQQDINKLYDLMLESPDWITFKDLLLDNRNNNWIPVIAAQAKRKPTFFAFGAGHLAGEQGVIKLLQKQGYKVEPIR
jgi:uncharacterized protein YbaP (TraB family)